MTAYACRSLVRNRVGRSIWMVRQSRRLTQRELARRVKTSRAAISNMERGEKLPTVATLRRVAKSLDVPCSVLLRLAEMEERETAVAA